MVHSNTTTPSISGLVYTPCNMLSVDHVGSPLIIFVIPWKRISGNWFGQPTNWRTNEWIHQSGPQSRAWSWSMCVYCAMANTALCSFHLPLLIKLNEHWSMLNLVDFSDRQMQQASINRRKEHLKIDMRTTHTNNTGENWYTRMHDGHRWRLMIANAMDYKQCSVLLSKVGTRVGLVGWLIIIIGLVVIIVVSGNMVHTHSVCIFHHFRFLFNHFHWPKLAHL